MANEQNGGQGILRKSLRGAVLLVCLSMPTLALAANTCPWMNEATASALLGGQSMGAYSPAGTNQPAVCTFTQSAADVMRTLKITVASAQEDPHARFIQSGSSCQSDAAPLKAIGNEAITCALNDGGKSHGARAVGRVRDQIFEILITTTRIDDPILTRDALKIRMNTAAEQTAGNLF